MGIRDFIESTKASFREQAEKRRNIRELELKTAPENRRIERERLNMQLTELKEKRELRDLKKQVRSEKLSRFTQPLKDARSNLSSLRQVDKNARVAKGRMQNSVWNSPGSNSVRLGGYTEPMSKSGQKRKKKKSGSESKGVIDNSPWR